MDSSAKCAEQPKVGSRLWGAAKVCLAAALVTMVVSRTNWANLTALKEGISPGWLALSAVAYLGVTLAMARRYWHMLGRKVTFRRVLTVVVQQNIVSTYGASSAGAASYILMLKSSDGVAVSAGIGSLLLAKMGDLLVATIGLAVSAAMLWSQIESLHGPLLALLALGAGGLFTCALLLTGRDSAAAWLKKLLVDRLPSRLMDGLKAMGNAVSRPASGWATRLPVYSAIMQLLAWTGNYAILRGFSLNVSGWTVLMALSLCQMMLFLPIQVLGGLGVVEITGLYVYGLFGLDQGRVASVLLADRVLFYLWVLIPMGLLPFLGHVNRNKTAQVGLGP